MPFCKVCYDAKRPESEYTSHFVKDQPGGKGIIVCPTLLNQACRICHNAGHTSSYCPQYRRSSQGREEPRREEPRREDRYREEPRREDRYREEPRREDRYREEPRREDRYREEPRREDRYREEERYIPREEPRREEREEEPRREEPRRDYRRPRIRISLEAPALYASKHAEHAEVERVERVVIPPISRPTFPTLILDHTENWGDENVGGQFVRDPEKMCEEFISSLTTRSERDFDFIEQCDDQSKLPWCCE